LHGDEDQHETLHSFYNRLNDMKNRFLEAGMHPKTVTSEILPERLGVAQDLHDEAAEQGCDTIVVGRRSSALSHIFGSVSSSLVKKAHPLSVWVVG
jgi:nucleotide-binding universal stress UspA family protein